MNCSREGCNHEAVKIPVLLLYPMVGCDPAEMRFDLPLCQEHSLGKVEDYVNDEGWRYIVNVFRSQALLAPIRELTGIRFDQYKETEKWRDC